MKKLYTLILLPFCFGFIQSAAQPNAFCDATGNVAIYSNYDGGILRINVDMNIANLKIGITGYENDSVIISGAYVNNVTQVIFAGYYNSSNVHCSPWPSQKSINGVSAAITQINFVPAATYNNPNGYLYIICNIDCDDSTSQGGCNTPDQVVDYFFNQFNSTKLLFHYTQYGCWSGIYNISSGGNCCSVPPGTGINESMTEDRIYISPNPSDGRFKVEAVDHKMQRLMVYDVLGNIILNNNEASVEKPGDIEFDISNHPKGIYYLKVFTERQITVKKLVLE